MSGTPTTTGAFSYTVEVTDSGGTPQTATQLVSGTIAPSVLTLTSTPSATTQVGSAYAQSNVAGGGTPGYTYAISGGGVPAGTSLDTSTGLVSGTPTTAGAFSYTVEVTDSGGTPQTASRLVSGTIISIATTTSLVSSLNPSYVGQQVTLTATVGPAPGGGSVTFQDGATVLCSSAPLVSGIATCAVSFAAGGQHPLTASYSGAPGSAASTSAVLAQGVSDQSGKTVETIGQFLSHRNDLIAANEPDDDRQIDRLQQAGGSGGGQSSSSLAENSSMPASPAFAWGIGPLFGTPFATRRAGGDRVTFDPWNAGETDEDEAFHKRGNLAGRLRAASARGPMHLGFSTSLSQMLAYGAAAEERRAQGARRGAGAVLDYVGSGPRIPMSPFDIWVEGKYTSFRDDSAASDLEGHFGLFSIGADYVLSPSMLIGALAQFDTMREKSQLQSSEAEGHGWMVGPYATLRLTDEYFWQSRVAWGRSDNDVSPFLTYTDSFETVRWLVSSKLTGRWTHGAWRFNPSVSVTYMEDNSEGYADTFGLAIPGVDSRLGQARIGPDVGYHHAVNRSFFIEPHAGVELIWNFADDAKASGLGSLDGDAVGPTGVRGRANFGVRAVDAGSFALDMSGSYDGIGAQGYDAFTGKASLSLPLP